MKTKNNIMMVYAGMLAAIIVISVYNSMTISAMGSEIADRIDKAREASRPADIELTVITDPGCEGCFNITPALDNIKKGNVNITSEKNILLSGPDSKNIIEKYAIDRIPAIIIEGETDKIDIRGASEKEGALIYTADNPPFTLAKDSKIVGNIRTWVIEDKTCDECADPSKIIDEVKKFGIEIGQETGLDRKSSQAKAMIEKYDIGVLPAVIFSSDMQYYDNEVTQNWESVGRRAGDGSYVYESIAPPYIDLKEDRLRGITSSIYLEDKSCTECYSAEEFHSPIVKSLGLFIEKERKIDSSSAEGKELVKEYSITKLPTLILKGDLEAYPNLARAWENVGTVEEDGTYVFRRVEIAGKPYLNSGKVVTP